MEKQKFKMRKCFVLREVPIKFKDLRKGDVFRLALASENDEVDLGWGIAQTDAEGPPPHSAQVEDVGFVIFEESQVKGAQKMSFIVPNFKGESNANRSVSQRKRRKN